MLKKEDIIKNFQHMTKELRNKDDDSAMEIIETLELFDGNIRTLNEKECSVFCYFLGKAKRENMFEDEISVTQPFLFMRLLLELHTNGIDVIDIKPYLSEKELQTLNAYISLEKNHTAEELSNESFRYLTYLSKHIRLNAYEMKRSINVVASKIDKNIIALFNYQLQFSSTQETLKDIIIEKNKSIDESEDSNVMLIIKRIRMYSNFIKFLAISSNNAEQPQIKIMLDFMKSSIREKEEAVPFRHVIYYDANAFFSVNNEIIQSLKPIYEESRKILDEHYQTLSTTKLDRIKENQNLNSENEVYSYLLMNVVVENIFSNNYKEKIRDLLDKIC